ncbi:MAG: polyphenol oxidase family protein [Spirochaetes bacterium]|nr:polyphenol oxidase family protein [Spirochaetota bacterium]
MAADCSRAVPLGQPSGAALFAEIPLGGCGPRAGISLARAGDMDLAKHGDLACRARLLAALGVEPGRVRCVRQVHSRRVVRIDGSESMDGPFVEADGMVSDRPDLLLTVTVADCLPIFLADLRTGSFAVVHSGWKGTGIVVEAIRMMASAYGTRTADLAVTIGPGIGPCCYAVPVERYEQFRTRFGPRAVQRGLDGSFRLDLRGANASLLEREGVEGVVSISDCTSCSPLLGSFRREGAVAFTRMLAFIGAWSSGGQDTSCSGAAGT